VIRGVVAPITVCVGNFIYMTKLASFVSEDMTSEKNQEAFSGLLLKNQIGFVLNPSREAATTYPVFGRLNAKESKF